MAETVTIPHLGGEDHEWDNKVAGKPGWYSVRMYGSNEKAKPHIRCNCGEVTGIGLHHVHADGKVTASFWHAKEPMEQQGHKMPGGGCGWHVYLILADYNDGDFPPRP
jgi:hypothetical protein